MSKKTKQETKNTYEYIPTPVSPQVTQAESVAKDLRGQIDPTIRSSYAQARQEYDDSFDNPMGAYTTQAIRDASKRAKHQELSQAESSALTQANFLTNATDFERLMAMAQLTAPRLVQSGGNSTTTESGAGMWLPAIIGGAASIGSAALTGGAAGAA